MTSTPPELMTVKDVCSLLGVSRAVLNVWRRKGIFTPTPIKLGERLIRFRREDVESWLSDRAVA